MMDNLPENSLLDKINSPADVKKLSLEQLPQLAEELRREIMNTVAQTGGHLASNLGIIELTIALHYCLDTPKDKIIWDVGHQSYAHKILTGRRQKMRTLRQWQGLSGFPNKDESVYDTFTVGHGSTSISTALGLTCAYTGPEKPRVVVVIGDASLGGGMAFEALNHAGQLGKDMVVILNDNKMAISKSVGALSHYLNRILTMPMYNRVRQDWENLLQKIAPRLGKRLTAIARRLEEGLKSLLVPGMIFEELGFRYFGPIDGHNSAEIIRTLRNGLQLKGPVLIHAITQKGKGDPNAEKVPEKFHGVGSFAAQGGIAQTRSWTQVFSEKLIDLAKQDNRVTAVTAAMLEGTGLDKFALHFPQRCYDVGMAEAHAVGFSAGLAYAGCKPFVAIYSTFLQRSYDQIIHDVCLQNLPVTFVLDRAGIVGEDGPTHQGIFDLAYLRHIPNLSVLSPKDAQELEQMLDFALTAGAPLAIRYPKGNVPLSEDIFPEGYTSPQIEQGRAEFLRAGDGKAAIVALGSMVCPSMQAAKILQQQNINCAVLNARFVTPLDGGAIKRLCAEYKTLIVIEEGVAEGGFGSAVLEFLEQEKITNVRVRRMALPCAFIPHARREFLLEKYGLTVAGIIHTVLEENVSR